jgi:hypothetical protein
MDFTNSSDFVVATIFRMVNLTIFLKAKGRPFEVLLKFNPRVGSGRKVLVWNFCFEIFQIDFASGPSSGDLLLWWSNSLQPATLWAQCPDDMYRGKKPLTSTALPFNNKKKEKKNQGALVPFKQ